MAATLLTLRTDLPYYRQEVTLDDETFFLELRWNARGGAWYLSLFDRDNTAVLAGRKVVINVPIWGRYRNLALPKGQLVAIDTTGKDLDAGETDLGTRVAVVYFDEDELAV